MSKRSLLAVLFFTGFLGCAGSGAVEDDGGSSVADLVSRHPDTSWAMDAKRHMLVQPLDLPSREEQQREQQQEQQRRDQRR
jgi:hypothetical protein